MHIVVLGAGRIGQYVAQSLSLEGHSVVLVDMNVERLQEAAQRMDVATKRGSATDWKLIAQLMEEGPEILIALSDEDEANLVACSIAKSLGNVRTIARVKDFRYLGQDRIDISRLFHVDHLVLPELLVADQAAKIALHEGIYSENFFHGGAFLRTIRISHGWPYAGYRLTELKTAEKKLIISMIHRTSQGSHGDEILFPHGGDMLLAGDEVTVIGDSSALSDMSHFFGISEKMPTSIVIAGGTLVAVHLARELVKKSIRVRIIESSSERCAFLAETLPDVAIIHHSGSDWEFMQQERIDAADVFVAATVFEEKNMMMSLLAKEAGCKKVIAVLSDEATMHLAEKLGVSHVVSTRIATTDRILGLVRAEKVNAVVSLYDARAEVLEVKVSHTSAIVGIPLNILGPRLPREMLIALIYNRGRLFVASGAHILSPQDEVVVITDPKHRNYVEQLF